MGKCTQEPGDEVKEPSKNSQPRHTVVEEYEQLSDCDPPDPPLPAGHHRKKHSELKNAYYFVDTTTVPGRASWTDPRKSSRNSSAVPTAFHAIWSTISTGGALDIANSMNNIKAIPGCADAAVVRRISEKLNAYTELRSRITAANDLEAPDPTSRNANDRLLKYAAMAVGHEVACGTRATAQGTRWSPYRSKPKKHSGASGTPKAVRANSRGGDVEVVFYAYSPVVGSSNAKLMVYSNQFGDLEAPRVIMSPVHGFSVQSPIVSGSIRVPVNSVNPTKTYCLALAQAISSTPWPLLDVTLLVQGDKWVREKTAEHCTLNMRAFEAGGSRKVNVWVTDAGNPIVAFPFAELDPALASEMTVHSKTSQAADKIMEEVEQSVRAGRMSLPDAAIMFEMASKSLNMNNLSNAPSYLERLGGLANRLEANGAEVTSSFLIYLSALDGASQEDQLAPSMIIADNMLELTEQVFHGHADQLLSTPANATIIFRAIEQLAALLMRNNNAHTFRCFSLLNHICRVGGMNLRGNQCQQYARAALRTNPAPSPLTEQVFCDEFVHIDSRNLLSHDLVSGGGPYSLAEMFINASPSKEAMLTVLRAMVSKADQGGFGAVPIDQLERQLSQMLQNIPLLKAFWQGNVLEEVIQLLAPITEPDSVLEEGLKNLLARYVSGVGSPPEVHEMRQQVVRAANGQFQGVEPLGSQQLCLALLRTQTVVQVLSLDEMISMLGELYNSAMHWTSQKAHKDALYDYLQRKLISQDLITVFKNCNKLSMTDWLKDAAQSVCQSKLQSSDNMHVLQLVADPDMELKTLVDPLRLLLVHHLENVVSKRCKAGLLSEALHVCTFTIDAQVNLNLGLSLLDQFSKTTFGFLEKEGAYKTLLNSGPELLGIASDWSEFQKRNENVIDRNGTTVHLVGQIKHHLEEMIRQLMDSGITMDRMRQFVGHRVALKKLFEHHECRGHNKQKIEAMFGDWVELSTVQQDRLTKVTKFVEQYCKSLKWNHDLDQFVKASHDLRNNKWNNSTMEQVKESAPMRFIAKHETYLDQLANILGSQILLLGVCDRAKRQHSRTDSSPLSEASLFDSLIPLVIDEWNTVAPALVDQTVTVKQVTLWFAQSIEGLVDVSDNKGLEHELKTVAKTTGQEGLGSELINAFNAMLFTLKEQAFMFSFVELCTQLKRHHKFKDEDNKFSEMSALCDQLKGGADRITLRTIGDQNESLRRMAQVFAQIALPNREILKVLNEVQKKDHIISFLETMQEGRHRFEFFVDNQSFQSFEEVVTGNRRVYSAQQMEAFESAQQLRPLIVNVLTPQNVHTSLENVIKALLNAVKGIASDDPNRASARISEANAPQAQSSSKFMLKLRQVKTILTTTGTMVSQRADPTKLDAEFLVSLIDCGLWKCVNPEKAAANMSQGLLEQECVSIVHAGGGKFRTPEGAETSVITYQQASDLSDRILLIDGSILLEVGATAHAEVFQKMVSRVASLNSSLVQLHMSGHVVEGSKPDGSYHLLLPMSEKAAAISTQQCNIYKSAEQISRDADVLQKQLKKWKNGVERRRSQQPSLNYFSVLQLMQLVKDCQHNQVVHVQRAVEYMGVPKGDGDGQSKAMAQHMIHNMANTKSSGAKPRGLSRVSSNHTQTLIQEGAWAEGLFLLTELGNSLDMILAHVGQHGGTKKRPLQDAAALLGNSLREMFIPGEPHLVQTERGCDVLPMCLTVFAHFNRLPEPPEVLVCTTTTRYEEVELLVHRCCDNNHNDNAVYAIVQPEQLTVSRQLSLVALIKEKQRWSSLGRLVMITSSEDNTAANLADAFSKYGRSLPLPSDEELKALLDGVFGAELNARSNNQHVKVYKSNVAGTGKSYRIKQTLDNGRMKRTAIPVFHNTTQSVLMDKYAEFADLSSQECALHIMLSPTCKAPTDALLFTLIVLGDLLDADGRHYDPSGAKYPTLVEFPTLGTDQEKELYAKTLRFVDLLPEEMIEMNAELLDTSSNEVQMACRWLQALSQEVAGNQGNPLSRPADGNYFKSRKASQVSHGECLAVLREYAPPISSHAGAGSILDQSMILLTYWIRCLVVNGLAIIDSETESNYFKNSNISNLSKQPDITAKVIRRLVDMSSSITARAISTKSLLAEQVTSLGMDPNSKVQTLALMDQWSTNGLFVPTFTSPNPNHDYGNMVVNFGNKFESLCLGPNNLDPELKRYWQSMPATINWQKFVDYTGEMIPAIKQANGDMIVTHDLSLAGSGQISMQEAGVKLLKDVTGTAYPGGKDLHWNEKEKQPDGTTGPGYRARYVCHELSTSRESRQHTMATFTLTIDNVMKMLAVFFRTKAGMPVVIMGETGCGKTYSIKYLATFLDLPFYKMDVHGGLTEQDIVDFMTDQNGPIVVADKSEAMAKAARDNHKNNFEKQAKADDVWVFFDEVNTCDSVGLFKEMVCDHSMRGTPLPSNLKVLAALNPYRLRPSDMDGRTKVGIEHKNTEAGPTDAYGMALRDLVYVVHPIPRTMLEYVWDYGTLKDVEEERYMRSMLRQQLNGSASTAGPRLKEQFGVNSVDSVVRLFSGLMQKAHEFLRKANGGEVSVVSLRDVSRCVRLFEWFYDFVIKLDTMIDNKSKAYGGAAAEDSEGGSSLYADRPRSASRLAMEAITLSLAHCYYFRLQDNDVMDRYGVSRSCFRRMVEQEVGQTTDGNWRYYNAGPAGPFEEIIQEKMDWIIQAMDPLPPGIAPNVALRENMFMMIVCVLNKFPLIVVGNPGTSKTLAMTMIRDKLNSSTKAPDFDEMGFKSIRTFGYQCSRHSTADEIERCFDDAIAAEKAMKGVISVVFLDEVGLAEESPALPLKVLHKLLEKPEVAFVGLSNWDLDPAKMNRAIYLVRPETRSNDLCATATAIIGGANAELLNMMSGLAEAYLAITFECNEGRLKHQYKDFIGLRDFYTFVKLLDRSMQEHQKQLLPSEFNEAVLRSFGGMQRVDMLGLVCQTFYMKCKMTLDPLVFGRCESPEEAMLLEAPPLALIQKNLTDFADGDKPGGRHLMILSENESGLGILTEAGYLTAKDTEFIFGSAFPDDNSRDNVYRNINKVKECMKTGRRIVLLNLEGIYESLYDMLNQQYTKFLGKTFCRLAVGSTSRLCEVADDFRCIMVVNSEVAYKSLDAPLLNRFEKQVLSRYDLLKPANRSIQQELLVWCIQFLTPVGRQLPKDVNTCNELAHSAFPGIGPETLSSLVYSLQEQGLEDDNLRNAAKDQLLWIATPEAVMRVGNTCLSANSSSYSSKYFETHHHESLGALLNQLTAENPGEAIKLLVSTFSGATENHTDLAEAGLIDSDLKQCVILIDTMDSVKTITDSIASFFNESSTDEVLILQGDMQNSASLQRYNHTRYIVDEHELLFKEAHPGVTKHVVMVAHLHKHDNNFGAVQPLPLSFNKGCHYATIDSLMPCSPPLKDLKDSDATKIFNSANSELNIEGVLKSGLRHCMAYLVYPGNIRPNPKQQLRMLEELVQKGEFMAITKQQVLSMINEESLAPGWQLLLPQSEIAAARTFTRALAVRLERLILKAFTQFMSIIDRNRNINILNCAGAAGEGSVYCDFEDLWFKLLKDSSFCTNTLQFPSVSANVGEIVVSVSDKAGAASFFAAFPFSKYLCPAVQDLLELQPSLMDATPQKWSTDAPGYINAQQVGKLVGSLSHAQTLAYLRDLAQLKLGGLPQCAHLVPSFRATVEAIAVTFAMDKTNRPFNNCFEHMVQAHLALVGAKDILEPILTIQSQLLQLDVPTRIPVTVFKQCTQGQMPAGYTSGNALISLVAAFTSAIGDSVLSLIPEEKKLRPWEKAMPRQSQAPHMMQCYRTITLITSPMRLLLEAVLELNESMYIDLNMSWNKLLLLKDLLYHLLLPHDEMAGPAVDMLRRLTGNFKETADMLTVVEFLGSLNVVKAGFSSSIWNFVSHYICKFCFMNDELPSQEVQGMVLHIVSYLDSEIEAVTDAHATTAMKDIVRCVMDIARKGGNSTVQFEIGDLVEMMRLLIGKSSLMGSDLIVQKIGQQISEFADKYDHNDHKYAVLVMQSLEDRFYTALDFTYLETDSVNFETTLLTYAERATQAIECADDENVEMFKMLEGIAYARLVLSQGAHYVVGGSREDRKKASEVLNAVCELMNGETGLMVAYKKPHQQFFMKHMQNLYGLQPSILKLIDPDVKLCHPGIECEELSLQSVLSSGDPCVPSADPFYMMLGDKEYGLGCQGVKNALLAGDTDTLSKCLDLCRSEKQKDLIMVMSAFGEGYLSRTVTKNYGGLSHNSSRIQDFSNRLSNGVGQFATSLCKNDLQNPILRYETNRDVDQVLMIRPLIHLAAAIFSSPQLQQSVWGKLMLEPAQLATQHLPSMPEDEWNEVLKSMTENVGIYECPNGHRYTIGNCTRPSSSAKCPECGASIGGAHHTLGKGNKLVGFNKTHGMKMGSYAYHTEGGGDLDTSNIGVIGASGAEDAPAGYGQGIKPNEGHMGDSYRNVKPATYRVMRYMVHGLLGLSIGMGHRSNVAGLLKNSNPKEPKSIPDDDFTGRLVEDFTMLKRLLDCSSEEVSLRLHMIIEQLEQNSQSGLGGAKNRNLFEHQFENKVVKPILDSPRTKDTVAAMKEASASGKEMMQLGNELDELTTISGWNSDKRNREKPSLYRFRQPVTSDMFWSRFSLLPKEAPRGQDDQRSYGELRVLQDEQENIALAAHLYALVHMQTLVLAKYECNIDKEVIKEMTVDDAIKDLKTPAEQQHWIQAFDAYRTGWNALCPGITQFGCEEIIIPPLQGPEDTYMMAVVLTGDKGDVMSKYAELVLQDCINKHNVIVSALQQGMINGADSVGLEAISQQSIVLSDMLEFNDLDWAAELRRTSKQSLEFGKGTNIKFSYGALCVWVREQLLGSKTQVTAMIRLFKFAGQEAFGATGPIGNVQQIDLENELAANMFAEMESLGQVEKCCAMVKQCRGFLSMMQLDEDQPLSRFAEQTVMFNAVEMGNLGDASGVVRTAVMLSNIRNVEARLVERLKPDALGELNEIYMKSPPKETCDKLLAILGEFDTVHLQYLDDVFVNVIRAQFANLIEHTEYTGGSHGTVTQKSIWELMLFTRVPPNHPDYALDIDMCEDEMIGQLYPMMLTGEPSPVPMAVCYLGKCLEMIRGVLQQQTNPGDEPITSATFMAATMSEKVDYFEQLFG